jgi:hypothetical protein
VFNITDTFYFEINPECIPTSTTVPFGGPFIGTENTVVPRCRIWSNILLSSSTLVNVNVNLNVNDGVPFNTITFNLLFTFYIPKCSARDWE